MDDDLWIDPAIERAHTPPGRFYADPALYERARERVFARAWHLVADVAEVEERGTARPLTLLEGCLDEPLVLTRDVVGALRCLSNVCTHRAFPVVREACRVSALKCGYHGRRFALDGRLLSTPEFEGCEGFPAPSDDLPQVRLDQLGRLLFVSLDPSVPFEALVAPLRERLAWAPWDALRPDPAGARAYDVAASWALYVDNYLEGFHIPFVHPGLARTLEWRSYRTLLLPRGTLQIGVGRPGEPCFALPADHPDQGPDGGRVAAYYFWLFPATMFNVYPWGLSINCVEPLGPTRTRVRYLSYVWDEALRERGAGAGLDQVELEDEAVVEAQQRALRSRLYHRGRYSPAQERGVHHFHRMLTAALRRDD